jgi:hypothetical protein
VTTKRKPVGHPAKQDADVAKLFRTMKANVELIRDLEGRLSPERMLELKAAALGLMWAYSELAGLPTPDQITGGKQ